MASTAGLMKPGGTAAVAGCDRWRAAKYAAIGLSTAAGSGTATVGAAGGATTTGAGAAVHAPTTAGIADSDVEKSARSMGALAHADGAEEDPDPGALDGSPQPGII